MRRALGVAVALLAASAALAAPPAPAPTPPPSFEQVWAAQLRAERGGDAAASEKAMADLRRMRVERNVEGHATLGLGFVQRGLEKLDAGDRDGAEEAFRSAVAIAPGLPDGHFALARALLKKGPLGVVPSIAETVAGTRAFLDTGRGLANARDLLTTAWLAFSLLLSWVVALVLVLRHGGLLLHDVQEFLGPGRARAAALALCLLALLLPVATFQGWGWLPLWWMALLFAYLEWSERGLALVLFVSALTYGPAVTSLEFRLRTLQNPLYHAGLAAVEGVPDGAAIARLEQAAAGDPQDRDLAYLLGAARKRSGRYEEAAELYRRMLAESPDDALARNNLANIEFLRGAFDSALARYRAGTGSANPEVAATSYYNLSLAHLQKFDYQAYNEARSNADRVARGLVARYDRWKYDTGDYAVVDLGLEPDQVWSKFAGAASGVAVRNVVGGSPPLPQAGALLASTANRILAALALFPIVLLVVARVRGPRALTLHCARCGTAFCRRCQLGAASTGQCSQCYHLFVVRDGVSGPARNRKMAEVQESETRRQRVFRALSVVAPGAGHLYSGRTLVGGPLLVAWLGVAALLGAVQAVPFTEASSRLVPPWWTILVVVVLAGIWLLANRLEADFAAAAPVRRPGSRRPRVPREA
ncbi:MAG: tetratricopeptide repeat protein [Vicinamibacteria bacterium]